MAKRLKFRLFDKFNIESAGGDGNGFIDAEDGAAIDLSDMPGIKRIFVSFAPADDTVVQITKTRGEDTMTTILRDGQTCTANTGYGPIEIAVSDLDTIDFEAVEDVGLDWIIIDASYKAEA